MKHVEKLPLKTIVLNSVFYPAFVVVTLLAPAVCTLPAMLIRLTAGVRRTLYIVRVLIRCYGFIVVRILPFPFVRVEYEDLEPGQRRNTCVFVCNHRSSADAFLMERFNCELVQVVNNWPFRIPVIGMIGRLAGYLDVKGMPFDAFRDTCCALLQEDVSVVAFPEGSRARNKSLQPFHSGIFRVAQAAHVPIVPVCICGTDEILPKGSGTLRPGVIKMRKLPALKWESFKDISPFVLKNQVHAMMQRELEVMERDPVDPTRNARQPNDGSATAAEKADPHIDGKTRVPATAYMPQAGEMCVIDTLLAVGDGTGEAEATILRSSPFVRGDGSIEECVFIEMIAQTIAAATGYERAERGGFEGYLVGVRRFMIANPAAVGDVLRIKVRQLAEFGDFRVVEGAVTRGDLILARGEVKVLERRRTAVEDPECVGIAR